MPSIEHHPNNRVYCLMENREEQILSEIRSMLSAVRQQLDRLDAKVAELHGLAGNETTFDGPIDLDIDDLDIDVLAEDLPVYDVPAEEPVLEALADVDMPSQDGPAHDAVDITGIREDLTEDPAVERASDAMAVPEMLSSRKEDEASVFSGASPIYEAAQSSPRKRKAVIDVMAEKQSWRTDIPGTGVKDIRSAISLNDRIIFINLLFKTDPMAFQDALTRINAMDNLDQVIDYIKEEHGDWDLDSELVYRFMMAVRRKVK